MCAHNVSHRSIFKVRAVDPFMLRASTFKAYGGSERFAQFLNHNVVASLALGAVWIRVHDFSKARVARCFGFGTADLNLSF